MKKITIYNPKFILVITPKDNSQLQKVIKFVEQSKSEISNGALTWVELDKQ